MNRAQLFVLAVVVFMSLEAGAVSTKVCFRTHGNYEDNNFALTNGTTEDLWTDDGSKPMRGARYTLRTGGYAGTIVANGYLGDGLGAGDPGVACSSSFDVPTYTTISIDIRSHGEVQGNYIHVYVPYGSSTLSVLTSVNTGSGGTVSKTVTSTGVYERILRIYSTMAYGLYRHAGGAVGKTYKVYPDNNDDDDWGWGIPGGSLNAFDGIYISEWGSGRKFVLIHELGHRLAERVAGGHVSGGDCGLHVDGCAASEDEDHSLGSQEHQTCAFAEGWAHFYAADVWNSDDELDCVYRYYKDEQGEGRPTVNCESASGSTNGSYPVGYMEASCPTPWSARGVELDWVRQLWDTHTDATNDPTFTTMINLARDSWSIVWGSSSVYSSLDSRATTVGGTLNSNWDGMKATNDIDH